MRSTREVYQHHARCFGRGDVPGTLSDYSEDAILILPDGIRRGHAELEPVFAGIFAEFAKPGLQFQTLTEIIEGDYAYVVWTAETPDNVYEMATDTFVIRDGKIVAQTFAAKISPK